jgi:prepilin-type N-terminal cleavage/methylation domain-containing protein
MRRTAQGFTLIEIMVVIAIIAGLVTTVAIVVPRMQETQKQTTCMNNLSQLGQIYLLEAGENRGRAQKYSGVALWLSYRKGTKHIQRGDERALICPGDQGVAAPDTPDDQKKWDNADLDNPPSGLCSYAARDFKAYPMNVESPDKEIVGCDRQGEDGKTMHHKNVIIIAFDHGDAQKMTREELGLSSDTEHGIAIGPEAENKMLQKVVYKKASHE